MAIVHKVWHLYVGGSWIGTLTPTGEDANWVYAEFRQGDAWGNFAPWFRKAYDAHRIGNDAAWEDVYTQLISMDLVITSDDGERYESPTIHIDGRQAWFFV